MTREQREHAIEALAECFVTCACTMCACVRASGVPAHESAKLFIAAAELAEQTRKHDEQEH